MGRTYNRRKFLQDSAAWAAALPTFSGSSGKFAPLIVETIPDDLKQAFLSPLHIPAQDPWFYNEYRNGFPFGIVELHPEPRIEDISAKGSYLRRDDYHAEPPIPPLALLMRDQVIDVTTKMDPQGNLAWDVPEGKWTVVRFGNTSIGKDNHPAPLEIRFPGAPKCNRRSLTVTTSTICLWKLSKKHRFKTAGWCC